MDDPILTRAEWLASCDVFDDEDGDSKSLLMIQHEGKIAFHAHGPESFKPGASDKFNPYKKYGEREAWSRGFNGELNLKTEEFRHYMKFRKLQETQYAPPYVSAGTRHEILQRREKSIKWREARYPDFPAAYERSQKK